MKRLYDSETNERLTARQLRINSDEYMAIICQSLAVRGEGHVRPYSLSGSEHPRVYAA